MASINAINNTISNNNLIVGNILSGASSSSISLQKSRAGGIITTGDSLGAILFEGNDGVSSLVTSQITSTSSGTIAATRIASDLKFYTHPNSTTASTLRMTIASTGETTIEAPDSGTGLTVSGGGLTVTAGGIDVTAGGLTVTAGGLTVTSGNTTLTPLSVAGHVINSAAGLLASSATTQYCVQVGSSTGAFNSLAIGTAGQFLRSMGAGANPAWSTTTYPTSSTQGDIVYASADNTFASLAKSASSTRYLANTGTSNAPQWDQVALTTGVTGVLPIANGGTNASSMTNTDGVCYFDGTSIVTTTVGTITQVLTSNGAGIAPTFQSLPSTSFPWTDETSNFNAAVNNGYTLQKSSGTLTAALPGTCAYGSIIRFCARKTSGPSATYEVSCPSMYIYGPGASTSTGITFTYGTSVELLCTVANSTWHVIATNGGTITYL